MIKPYRHDEVIILGAGLAGLSTAYHLEEGYCVYEKENEAGGMARSIYKDGYTFDYDGHLLHFRKQYTFELVSRLLNGNLAAHKRNSWIYSKGTFTRYPFQANFYGLPKGVVKDCLVELIRSRIAKGEYALNGNFKNWIIKTFGMGIAKHFMLPYNRKFWTVDPSELTCDWLDGFVPVPTLEDTITGAISESTKAYGYNRRFWYPVKGGISEIVDGFLREVKGIGLNKRVVTIDQKRREIIFEDGTLRRYKNLVTTIPLPELSHILINVPDEIKRSFLQLKFTSIFLVNLGIKREDLIDKHWVYYPEEEISFYRIGFPTNFSLDIAPQNRTSMYVEVSYRDERDIDRENITQTVIRDLKKIGMFSGEDEIELVMPLDIKYGYVIYDTNRASAVQRIKNYLRRFGIHSIGRYGSWKYMSMEDVILEGKEMSESLRLPVT